jgi:dTMP kinase
MRPDILIIEGPDYTGKSTNAKLVEQQLTTLGHKPIVVRAPGGSPLGEKLRDVARNEADSLEEQYLAYLLALVASKSYIEELVEEGFTVILDRWSDSLFAYQIAKETNVEKRRLMLEMAANMLSFHESIYVRRVILTISPETLERRRAANKTSKDACDTEDRFDASGASYRASVVETYARLAEWTPSEGVLGSFAAIDANSQEDEVSEKLLSFLLRDF